MNWCHIPSEPTTIDVAIKATLHIMLIVVVFSINWRNNKQFNLHSDLREVIKVVSYSSWSLNAGSITLV